MASIGKSFKEIVIIRWKPSFSYDKVGEILENKLRVLGSLISINNYTTGRDGEMDFRVG